MGMDPDMMASVVQDGFFAALAALGFSCAANPPMRAMFGAAVLGAVGHALRFACVHELGINLPMATFLASLAIGLLGAFSAKLLRCPAELFSFPALLPMIPGMYAYNTVLALMRFMLNEDESSQVLAGVIIDIFRNGLTTLFVTFSLVVGAAVPLMLFRKVNYTRRRAR